MIDDLVDLLHPYPDPPADDADDNARDALSAECSDVDDQRRALEELLRATEDSADYYFDPLLAEITTARRAMCEAEARLRLLIAYGREFVVPRPYQLKDLAEAAGMSISGTRSAYDDDEISDVAHRLGRPPRPRPDLSAPTVSPASPQTDVRADGPEEASR
jgi:hypothetical protein